jgi:hypothetical protein
MDGIWETGGPFRADDYAYRFTEYYNAMTAVDPTIILTGPIAGGPRDNTDAYDGLTYIQTFLNTMQSLGKTSDIGALDFHWYPGSTTAAAALGVPSQISSFAVSLSGWLSTAGVSPTIPVLMSETNINAGTPILMNQLPSGLWLANWLGEFIHYFGPGGHTNIWDTMNGSADLTSNTVGDQGYLDVEATYVNGGVTSANPYQYQPRANYWAMQMMSSDWAIAGDSNTHHLVSSTSSAATLVSYADYRPDGILSLMVVNKDPTNSYITNLNIGPFVPNPTANSWTFNSSNYAWETTSVPYHASPDTAPTTMAMTGVASSFPVTFSPYSINVIQFTNSGVPTYTPTSPPTPTASKTPTGTPTATFTGTPTASPTNSPTVTLTGTPTFSPTVTSSGTPTQSPTASPTLTSTGTATNSPTPTLTLTPTSSPSATATDTACTDGLGNTCTFTPTPPATATPTSSETNTPTSTATATFTPTVTFTPTNSSTSTFSPTFTISPTPTLSPTATSTPGLTGIFPNPLSGGAPLQLTYQLGQTAGQVKLKLFTVAFRKIFEDDSLPTASGGQLYVLDFSKVGSIANGLYYVVLYVKTGGSETHQVMKLLIQR